MSRTQERAGRKSSRRSARSASRRLRRDRQRHWWLDEALRPNELNPAMGFGEALIPENLRRRWQRRGLLGGGA